MLTNRSEELLQAMADSFHRSWLEIKLREKDFTKEEREEIQRKIRLGIPLTPLEQYINNYDLEQNRLKHGKV